MESYGWYAQRLDEEQEQLDAVLDALGALDADRFQCAACRINNRAIANAAAKLACSKDVSDALDALEALSGFLKARVEYLRPLAREESLRELAAADRNYAASL